MKILVLSMVGLISINNRINVCTLKQACFIGFTGHMTLTRLQQGSTFLTIYGAFHHIFCNLVVDFDKDFCGFDENNTCSDWESEDSD